MGTGPARRARLGPVGAAAERALAQQDGEQVVTRLWARDATLWPSAPDAASWLGWLEAPGWAVERAAELEAFATQVVSDGFTHVVHMGMGGSSLFAHVLAGAFPPRDGHPDLRVLDTTDPTAVSRLCELPLERTLFVAASKSGTTLETRCHLEYFWDAVRAGEQFVAVTDPGSPLEALARERGFRCVFQNPSDIGGRYSALSYFGLVPAALLGVELPRLLERAERMVGACREPVASANPGAWLGAVAGAATTAGHDKLTLLVPPELGPFDAWVEQLVAESTGKRGTGIVPVVGEPIGAPEVYGDDRLFVAWGEHGALDALAGAGMPVVELDPGDAFDLGAEVVRWEVATALAGRVLGIDPFDQPDVAAAKDATARVLREGVPEIETTALADVLGTVRPGDYVAVQAFVDPGDAALAAALQRARVAIRDRMRVATTLGFGPRYLHSTGQVHKGGPPTGVFVQVVSEDGGDVPVPGASYGFSTLERAQAAGDLLTLRQRGRRVARVALDDLLGFGR